MNVISVKPLDAMDFCEKTILAQSTHPSREAPTSIHLPKESQGVIEKTITGVYIAFTGAAVVFGITALYYHRKRSRRYGE